ncbi:hypothetical protein PHMEG_00025626 [Phytophthora megakarya]|uniref:Uncharacterized protein n=1 Tax=Phytophthora megakarya TaxID=4795 RepID=A0A225VAN5_9STRA|nr:hypothetical protein PHMEG_00025626 [Phytophthora megakarya]
MHLTFIALDKHFSREFDAMRFSVRGHAHRYSNVGRAKRSTFSAKAVLIMMLAVMKCGGTWSCCPVKTLSFIKVITDFIAVITPKLYEEWVSSHADETTMRGLVTSGHTFGNFPSAM